MDQDVCRRARMVLGGVAPIPWRLPEVEKMLAGQRVTPVPPRPIAGYVSATVTSAPARPSLEPDQADEVPDRPVGRRARAEIAALEVGGKLGRRRVRAPERAGLHVRDQHHRRGPSAAARSSARSAGRIETGHRQGGQPPVRELGDRERDAVSRGARRVVVLGHRQLDEEVVAPGLAERQDVPTAVARDHAAREQRDVVLLHRPLAVQAQRERRPEAPAQLVLLGQLGRVQLEQPVGTARQHRHGGIQQVPAAHQASFAPSSITTSRSTRTSSGLVRKLTKHGRRHAVPSMSAPET